MCALSVLKVLALSLSLSRSSSSILILFSAYRRKKRQNFLKRGIVYKRTKTTKALSSHFLVAINDTVVVVIVG